jgi:hypothetical protein
MYNIFTSTKIVGRAFVLDDVGLDNMCRLLKMNYGRYIR